MTTNKEFVKALYSYKSTAKDELVLVEDQVYEVVSISVSGWYHVRDTTTQKIGWIPSNYVEKHIPKLKKKEPEYQTYFFILLYF